MTKYLSEFFASCTLVFFAVFLKIINYNTLGVLGVAFVIGFLFMALIYIFSGKRIVHVLPIVSLAMLLSKKISFRDFCVFVLLQFIGAICAVTLFAIITQTKSDFAANILKSVSVFNGSVSHISGIIIELFVSFIFMLTYLSIVGKKEISVFSGMALGFLMMVVVAITFAINNGSINPAYALATSIFQGDALSQLYIFLLVPFVGSMLAYLAHKGLSKERENG